MTHQDLMTLVDYHYWARDRMLSAVAALGAEEYARPLDNSFGSVRDTAVHIYSADWIWAQRWQGRAPTAFPDVARYPDVPSLSAAWRVLESEVRTLLEAKGETGIAEAMDYRLLSGAPGRSVLWHMVQHVVNHGSYHRGQVTTLLRQLGATPPAATDLIAYYREREKAS